MTSTNKILVVDDEPDIRNLIREILEDERFEVAVAEDAKAADRLRETFAPDLVLLDIWMPDIDGITLLKQWRSNGRIKMPVVMISGHGTVETAVEATRLGAYDFIEKPVSLAKLLLTVNHALEHDTLQRENNWLKELQVQHVLRSDWAKQDHANPARADCADRRTRYPGINHRRAGCRQRATGAVFAQTEHKGGERFCECRLICAIVRQLYDGIFWC